MKCKNCEEVVNGNYCNYCGQKTVTNRINGHYILSEASNSIFQFDHGLLYTVKELFINPGVTIRMFIEGKRKNHYKPLAFLLFFATLNVFVFHLLNSNFFIFSFMEGSLKGMASIIGMSDTSVLINYLNKNQVYIILITLPFLSLASYLVFFTSKYNYFEHLIINSFIYGQKMFIYLIFTLILNVFYIDEYYLGILTSISGFIYFTWSYLQVFNKHNYFIRITQIIITSIIYLILLLFISGAFFLSYYLKNS